MSQTTETVLLIDSNALIHRAYHAFPKHLTTRDGSLVNAAYGFTRLLLTVLKQFKPKYVVCAFDTHAPTFRHHMFKEYKATRKKTDEELIEQFPIAQKVLEVLNIPMFMQDGLEADDIIGTLSRDKELNGVKKIIVTGDKDLLQLINSETEVFLSGTSFSKSVLYGPMNVADKIGFDADKLIDFKGLRGDSSDNIPGVRGIGDKTALTLIKEYGTIEKVYENLDKLKTAAQNRLRDNLDIALLSRELATIKLDADLDFKLSDAKLSDYDKSAVLELFSTLQFKSLIKDLPKVDEVRKTGQMGLLDVNVSVQEETKKPVLSVFKPYQSENINELYSLMQEVDEVAIDLMLEDQEDIFSEIDQLSLCLGADDSYIVNYSDLSQTQRKEFVENLSKKRLLVHEGKHILHGFLNDGFADVEIYFDVQVADFLLSYAKGKNDLPSMVFTHLGTILNESDSLTSEQILANRVESVFKLYQILKMGFSKADKIKKSNDWGIEKLFYELEMPLQRSLVDMERNGILLDVEYLEEFSLELDKKKERISKDVFAEIGYEFNLASPKQLGEALFEKMGLPGGKKNKSGGFSTNERVLKNLRNDFPIVEKILQYREVSKLRSTYTDALIALVNIKSGRVHSSFSQVVAATGRLSSSKPNLQNIPISSKLGQGIRKSFKAPEGKLFIFIDYSQQELRLLAHFSQEENLISAFRDNKDIHSLTASKLFGKEIDEITKNERRIGKTVNFGVVYGISAFGLSEGLQMSRDEGQKFIDAFYVNYPKVKAFFTSLISDAKRLGYVQTILGRRRDTTLLGSSNYQVRSGVEREVINYPLQGSAADMMKLAMLRVNILIKSNYSDYAKLILQIHDELVFEINTDDEVEPRLIEFINEVKKIMLEVLDLDLPMKVDVEYGRNLSETNDY